MSEFLVIALELIDPPAQAIRQHIDDNAIDELARSIRDVGLIEPLVLERTGERYRVIAGHRRLMACKRAGLLDVECKIQASTGVATEAVQTHENIYREDMSPAEEARLFLRLYDELDQDIERVAGKLRLSVGYVDRRLQLLAGDELVLEALDKKFINMGVAEALNSITRDDFRRERLSVAVAGGATIDLARRWARECNGLASIQPPPQPGTGETPAEAPYVPVSQSLECWFCEGNHDLHTLRMVQMHESCVKAADALLKKIGRQ